MRVFMLICSVACVHGLGPFDGTTTGHGPGIVDSFPPSNAIDARQPTDPDGLNEAGWDRITITFDEDVPDIGPEHFRILGDDELTVSGFGIDGPQVTITTNRPIRPGRWTVLYFTPTRQFVSLGFLPGDVNGDGIVHPSDITALGQHLNGQATLDTWQCDIDRSGVCDAQDIVRHIDLLNGAGQYTRWLGRRVQLPPRYDDEFTAGLDFLVGGIDHDVHTAWPSLDHNLTTGDVLYDMGGQDVLRAHLLLEAPLLIAPEIHSVERLYFHNYSPHGPWTLTVDVTDVDGMTRIVCVDYPVAVTALHSIVELELSSDNRHTSLTAQFADSDVTAGQDDALLLLSEQADEADFALITPPGVNNGVESLRIESRHTLSRFRQILHVQADATPDDLTDNPEATSLSHLLVTGDAPLELTRLPGSVRHVEATGAAGALLLGTGDGSAFWPYASFHDSNHAVDLLGGDGNDLFVMGPHLDARDHIDGGPGVDTVQVDLLTDRLVSMSLHGIEWVHIDSAGPQHNIDLAGAHDLLGVRIAGHAFGNTHDQLVLHNRGRQPLFPKLHYSGDGRLFPQRYSAVSYFASNPPDLPGTLALLVDNHGMDLPHPYRHVVGCLDIPAVNQLNISTRGLATFNDFNAPDLVHLLINGTAYVDLGHVRAGGSLVDIFLYATEEGCTVRLGGCADGVAVAAPGFANVNLEVDDSEPMMRSTITTGPGRDLLVINDIDSRDTIDSGPGDDTITARWGDDDITPGGGEDTVVCTSAIGPTPVNEDGADVIHGFTHGDRLRFSAQLPAVEAGLEGVDDATVISADLQDTRVIVDLDTDPDETEFLIITLKGVTLTPSQFVYPVDRELIRR